jgi:hypothetical protein
MKTFFTILLAILAAAAVIFGALAAKSRLDNWNKARSACLEEIDSMSETISDLSAESAGGNIAELNAALTGMLRAQKRINRAKDVLVSLLKNKPFFLPLTEDEKRLLRAYAAPAESNQAAVATSISTNATASPEATASPPPLSSETVQSQQSAPQIQPQPAPEIQPPPPPAEYVILNRDVEVSRGTKKIVIPKGSRLPVVSRGSHTVGVHFEGEQQIISKSATGESK